MSKIHGSIMWSGNEATLCDDDGKTRARAWLQDDWHGNMIWNVYEATTGVHVGSVPTKLPAKVTTHLVDALLVAAAEVEWVEAQA